MDPYKEKLAGLGKETAELERANKRAKYELERLQAYKVCTSTQLVRCNIQRLRSFQ